MKTYLHRDKFVNLCCLLILGAGIFVLSTKVYASFSVVNTGSYYDIDVTYGAISHDEKYKQHVDLGENNNHRVSAYSEWTKFDDHITADLWTEYYWNGVWRRIE